MVKTHKQRTSIKKRNYTRKTKQDKNRSNKNKIKNNKRNNKALKGGGPKDLPCSGMYEGTVEAIEKKLICCKDNGRNGLYMRVVIRLINSDKGFRRGNDYGLKATEFIQFIYDKYKTDDSFKNDIDTQNKLRGAFVTMQEEAVKTYNLEHALGTNNSQLLPKDW